MKVTVTMGLLPSQTHSQCPTKPDPVIGANKICSLGAGAFSNWAKQSHSAPVIHRKQQTSITSALGPLRFGGGSFDTEDKDLCCYFVITKLTWYAIAPGVNTKYDFIGILFFYDFRCSTWRRDFRLKIDRDRKWPASISFPVEGSLS